MRRITFHVALLAVWVSCGAGGCGRPPAPEGAQTEPAAAAAAPAEPSTEEPAGEPAATIEPAVEAGEPVAVVVWISVDGLRGDYVDWAETPFLNRMMREGAYSRELAPVFPSLTFPAHVSQVTGALVQDHGIVANALYDLERDRRWSYPNDNSLILCEPIWNTAKRQGRRVAVFDWPVSQKQTGPDAADYFNHAYDTNLSDRARLERLWDVWARDSETEPLQLLMGYFPGVDKAGHRYGPNAPETRAAVEEADRLLTEAFDRCRQLVAGKYGDDAVLYFVVSTDHGMEELHSYVSLSGLLGDALTEKMRWFTSGNVANIYLEYIEEPEAKRVHTEYILERLRRYEFARAYHRDDLPAAWGYNAPGRTGDVVVSIEPGYFFSDRPGPPIRPADPDDGPIGMHGYSVEESPEMYGFLGIWRNGEPIGGIDLGEVDSRRLHATVAQMLGIEPAPTALDEPLPHVVSGDAEAELVSTP